MAGVDARGPAMAVSKAPAPPPGLEAPPASSHMSAQNFQAYAYTQQSWTPMGNLPPTVAQSLEVFRQALFQLFELTRAVEADQCPRVLEAVWRQPVEKVLHDSGKLLQKLDEVVPSRLEDDLRRDVAAECESWTSEQLSSQNLAPDSALAELYRGFAGVARSVTVKEQLTGPEADGSLKCLRLQIQDVCRRCIDEVVQLEINRFKVVLFRANFSEKWGIRLGVRHYGLKILEITGGICEQHNACLHIGSQQRISVGNFIMAVNGVRGGADSRDELHSSLEAHIELLIASEEQVSKLKPANEAAEEAAAAASEATVPAEEAEGPSAVATLETSNEELRVRIRFLEEQNKEMLARLEDFERIVRQLQATQAAQAAPRPPQEQKDMLARLQDFERIVRQLQATQAAQAAPRPPQAPLNPDAVEFKPGVESHG